MPSGAAPSAAAQPLRRRNEPAAGGGSASAAHLQCLVAGVDGYILGRRGREPVHDSHESPSLAELQPVMTRIPVGILCVNLGDNKAAHAGSSTSSASMGALSMTSLVTRSEQYNTRIRPMTANFDLWRSNPGTYNLLIIGHPENHRRAVAIVDADPGVQLARTTLSTVGATTAAVTAARTQLNARLRSLGIPYSSAPLLGYRTPFFSGPCHVMMLLPNTIALFMLAFLRTSAGLRDGAEIQAATVAAIGAISLAMSTHSASASFFANFLKLCTIPSYGATLSTHETELATHGRLSGNQARCFFCFGMPAGLAAMHEWLAARDRTTPAVLARLSGVLKLCMLVREQLVDSFDSSIGPAAVTAVARLKARAVHIHNAIRLIGQNIDVGRFDNSCAVASLIYDLPQSAEYSVNSLCGSPKWLDEQAGETMIAMVKKCKTNNHSTSAFGRCKYSQIVERYQLASVVAALQQVPLRIDASAARKDHQRDIRPPQPSDPAAVFDLVTLSSEFPAFAAAVSCSSAYANVSAAVEADTDAPWQLVKQHFVRTIRREGGGAAPAAAAAAAVGPGAAPAAPAPANFIDGNAPIIIAPEAQVGGTDAAQYTLEDDPTLAAQHEAEAADDDFFQTIYADKENNDDDNDDYNDDGDMDIDNDTGDGETAAAGAAAAAAAAPGGDDGGDGAPDGPLDAAIYDEGDMAAPTAPAAARGAAAAATPNWRAIHDRMRDNQLSLQACEDVISGLLKDFKLVCPSAVSAALRLDFSATVKAKAVRGQVQLWAKAMMR